jgi:hypothetical protein
MDTVRKTVQRAARWLLWDRIWPMIEARVAPVEARVASLEARVGSLEARVAPFEARVAPFEARVASLETRVAPCEARVAQFETAWHQHVPAFLNTISTVRSFGFELAKTSQESRNFGDDILGIRQRIEFLRREIFSELKYGQNASVADAPSRVRKNRVIASEKLAAAQAIGLRMNLGCGHVPLEGYVNVDQRELPGVDVVADAGDLPVEPGTSLEIFSAHLVEHFPQEMLRCNLLPYWKALLMPGGMFRAVVLDGEAMLTGIAAGTYSFEDFREALFGSQDCGGDFHFNLLTPDSFTVLLREAGFTDIAVPVKARRNMRCFEFEICALRDASIGQDIASGPALRKRADQECRGSRTKALEVDCGDT